MKKIDSYVQLNNGVKMPAFGLGLYRAPKGKVTIDAIKWAYEAGYRMFDTAQIYNNEKETGDALKQLGIPRNEVFVTTKLWNANHGEQSIASFEKSLELLQLDYVDLFLMHWPVKDQRLKTWDKIVSLLDEGKARAIGVSNFMVWHLEELRNYSDVVPSVNQVELSPYLNEKELIDFCQNNNIIVESYSPLTKGRKLDDPKLVSLANKYGKTPAQLLIRWAVDNDLVVIPKSTRHERIKENADIFDFAISAEDLSVMNTWNEGLVTGWDPRGQD